MRVIAGWLGGRRLHAPPGRSTRPTSERVREALFSSLGPLDGVRVLDLYAGTGALGIEALSRGAAEAAFVERSPASLASLQENLRALGIEELATVLRADAAASVRRLGRAGRRFDLVFADPPYAAGEAGRVLGALVEAAVLAPDARVVIEGSRRHPPPPIEGLRVVEERCYGDTTLVHLVPTRTGPSGPGGSTDR